MAHIEGAHPLSIDSLAFSPTDATLASGSDDRSIALWHATTNGLTEQQRLSGHADRIYGLAFTTDGSILASAGEDATARFWLRGRDGFAPLGQPIRLSGTARALAVTNHGTVLVAHSRYVDEWLATPEAWLAKACQVGGRSLTQLEVQQYLNGKAQQSQCT